MNRVAFNIFGLNIYYYSLCILLGVIISYILITKEGVRKSIKKSFLSDLIFYTLLIGILGARIYYVIFNLDYYLANPSEILKVYNGGLAIHGGVIFGIIFVYFYTKRNGVNFIKILDICAPAVLLAQCIGRWGNFFNQEAYGSQTTLEHLKNLHIPNFIINGMHINGNYYYPTFFFESIWCFIGFLVIMFMRKKIKNLKLGSQIGTYFIWYGVGRFFIEILRTDSLMFFGLKQAQIISLIGIVIGIILITNKRRKYYNEMGV